MTNDFTQRSTAEAETLAMFDMSDANLKARKLEWSSALAVLAMVWRARWQAALTIEQINETAKVLGSLAETPDLQDLVTLLARKRMLRSYHKQGRHLYEVNY